MPRPKKLSIITTKEPKTQPISLRITDRAKRNLIRLTKANCDESGRPASQTTVMESLIAWAASSIKKTPGRKSA